MGRRWEGFVWFVSRPRASKTRAAPGLRHLRQRSSTPSSSIDACSTPDLGSEQARALVEAVECVAVPRRSMARRSARSKHPGVYKESTPCPMPPLLGRVYEIGTTTPRTPTAIPRCARSRRPSIPPWPPQERRRQKDYLQPAEPQSGHHEPACCMLNSMHTSMDLGARRCDCCPNCSPQRHGTINSNTADWWCRDVG